MKALLWVLRALRIGPLCHSCRSTIVPCETAIPMPCRTAGHFHFIHPDCLLLAMQRVAVAQSQPEGRA